MDNGVAIELRGLTKTFPRGVCALDGVDLDIPRGSLLGLLGPNGSGKSTTVKILCGLIRTFQGEARIEGTRLPDRRCARLLGYMPQQTALYAELSVLENLDFYASINGVRLAAERNRRIDEMLGLLDLSGKKREVVETLSGGMRQRVSLAAALLHRPPILLLDEPTVGLDPELRLEFWAYFKRLAAAGSTIVICTHAFDEVKHCNHLAFLKTGRLVAFGSTEALRAGAGSDDWEAVYLAHVARAGTGGAV
ncbi:MAG: ABC transporter ATP-binding protein [Spirochaetes bacterium]|nr:ABC transporter ATP-binding protein [Spirochaetota bacterium]